MAYPENEEELKQRYHTYEDTGKPAFKDGTLGLLDRDFSRCLRDMGIPIGEDRKVPTSGGVPRIFVLGLDAEGIERPMSLEEAGLDLSPRNAKFWQQVSMGNVFAYPAGQDHPVQLHADASNYQGGFGYTKPVTPEEMPQRQVKRPGFFARLMNSISGGRLYKAEVNAYRNQQNREQRLEFEANFRHMTALREYSKDDEAVEAQEVQDAAARKAHQEKLDQKLEIAKDAASASADGYKILHSVYKPVPEKHEYLRKYPGKEGLYTDEHFASLKVFSKDELDLSKIALAPKGKIGPSVSEKDFCAVAMFAGMKPEIAEKTRGLDPKRSKPDRFAVSCLTNIVGITEEQAKQCISDDSINGYTTDMFIVPKSRDNSGTYFKAAVNDARQVAADAFNAYKNGNKEPLAKLLAYGIERTCNQMVSLGSIPGNEAKGCMQMGLHLTTIMNKDPELKELAFRNGMTKKQLKSVEAMSDYLKLDDKRRQAELKLAQAAAGHKELSAEEKEACMKDILKAKIVDKIWLDESKATTDKMREVEDKMLDGQEVDPDKMQLWKKQPEKRPAPPEGKFWMDTGADLSVYVTRLFRPIPPVIGTLKDQTSLDEVVDRMIKEDKPAEKSCEDLLNMYPVNSKQADKLASRSMRIAEDIKNEKLLGINGQQPVNEAGKKEPEKQAQGNKPAQADDYDIDINMNLNMAAEIAKRQGGGPQL